ncbi:MAG: response regulator [Pyrinomonadaceae bacterium]
MIRQRLINPFIWTIIVAGAAASVLSAYRLARTPPDFNFLLLLLLAVAVGTRISIKIPHLSSAVTVSDNFVFLTLMLYGGDAAVVTAAVTGICSATLVSKKGRTLLLNAAVCGGATFLAAPIWRLYAGHTSANVPGDFSGGFLIALCGIVFVQYVLTSAVAAVYSALKRNGAIWGTWKEHYRWTFMTYVAGASCAALTLRMINAVGFYTLVITTPIVGIIYFMYRSYLENIKCAEAQAEQSLRHVEELSHYIAEQERIREQFSQVEKMSALGQMASGVAHDLNNSLAAILGRAELMQRQTDDPKTRRGLDLIAEAARGGARTIKRIQDFARQRRDHDFTLVSIDDLLDDVSEVTQPRWKDSAEASDVHISLELANDSRALVLGDLSELRDVLVNMIFNAVDAMPAGGRLMLSAATFDNSVIISVRDTGLGMSAEVRARAFDPFFTTKGVRGMGLGLAVSYGIIRRHEGTISIESEVGRGTTFKIELPVAGVASNTARGRGESVTDGAKAPGKKLMTKILVVDDEEAVRELIREILEDEGYEVRAVSSGREGLALFDDEKDFDAVFTDVGMPGMSGWELARAIRERDAHVPLAVITGWGELVSTDEREHARVDWVLTKPFSMEQLAGIVEEVSRRRRQRIGDASSSPSPLSPSVVAV